MTTGPTTERGQPAVLGVNVAVLRGGDVLLMLRSELPVWCLPGGHIEAGESPERAALRETAEETGLEVALLGRVGTYVRPGWRPQTDRVALFAARPSGGRLHAADGEAAELRYFPADALPERLVWWHRQRVADAVAGLREVQREQPFLWRHPADSYRALIERVERGELAQQQLIDELTRGPDGAGS